MLCLLNDRLNIWGMCTHTLCLEGLSSLLSVAKSSSPGQVPNKPPASSVSGRLHEAQKYSISQFNLLQPYTYLELLKFIPSGSTHKISGLIITITMSLVGCYNWH